MSFENRNTPLKDVPWYVWAFYSLGIIVFFVLLLGQVWWYFAAANIFFLVGSSFSIEGSVAIRSMSEMAILPALCH